MVRTRTCYFAKVRPCASIIVYASFACLPLYFVVIEFIVLDLVVVSSFTISFVLGAINNIFHNALRVVTGS